MDWDTVAEWKTRRPKKSRGGQKRGPARVLATRLVLGISRRVTLWGRLPGVLVSSARGPRDSLCSEFKTLQRNVSNSLGPEPEKWRVGANNPHFPYVPWK